MLMSILSKVREGTFGAIILCVHRGVGGVDEQNLVSPAGLVPVLELAEQAALSRLIGQHVDLRSTRVRSGAVKPGRQSDLDSRRDDLRRRQHR